MRLAIFIIIMILVRIASELTAMDETWLFILEAVAGIGLLINFVRRRGEYGNSFKERRCC